MIDRLVKKCVYSCDGYACFSSLLECQVSLNGWLQHLVPFPFETWSWAKEDEDHGEVLFLLVRAAWKEANLIICKSKEADRERKKEPLQEIVSHPTQYVALFMLLMKHSVILIDYFIIILSLTIMLLFVKPTTVCRADLCLHRRVGLLRDEKALHARLNSWQDVCPGIQLQDGKQKYFVDDSLGARRCGVRFRVPIIFPATQFCVLRIHHTQSFLGWF